MAWDEDSRDLFILAITSGDVDLLLDVYSHHIQGTEWTTISLFFVAERLETLITMLSEQSDREATMHDLEKLVALFTTTDFTKEYQRLCQELDRVTKIYIESMPQRATNWTKQ